MILQLNIQLSLKKNSSVNPHLLLLDLVLSRPKSSFYQSEILEFWRSLKTLLIGAEGGVWECQTWFIVSLLCPMILLKLFPFNSSLRSCAIIPLCWCRPFWKPSFPCSSAMPKVVVCTNSRTKGKKTLPLPPLPLDELSFLQQEGITDSQVLLGLLDGYLCMDVFLGLFYTLHTCLVETDRWVRLKW